MKKLICSLIIIISLIFSIQIVNAVKLVDLEAQQQEAAENYGNAVTAYNDAIKNNETAEVITTLEAEKNAALENLNLAHEEYCAISKSCLESPKFMLDLNKFVPGGNVLKNEGNEKITFSQRVNLFLGNVIQKLVMAIGVVAIFIMTIGGAYMIINFGKDDLISKGKSIFMAGIYAVVTALASYLIIELVRNIIY